MRKSEAEMQALVGHEFTGGSYRIEHWENFLLTEATGAAPMPDGLAHPAHLFHVPIFGAGVTIADLFALGDAESDASITIDYYDWELLKPLREDETYRVRGAVTEHERKNGAGDQLIDSITYRFELSQQDGEPVAVVSFRWHYWKTAEA